MNFNKLSFILLLSYSSFAIKAMENSLTISTLQRTIQNKAEETEKLRKELKKKKKEAKANFAYYKRQVTRKLDDRDQEKALNIYNNSCETLIQEKLSQSKEMFTKEILPLIAIGKTEQLKYQEKFLKIKINHLEGELQKHKNQLAALRPGFFSRLIGY